MSLSYICSAVLSIVPFCGTADNTTWRRAGLSPIDFID